MVFDFLFRRSRVEPFRLFDITADADDALQEIDNTLARIAPAVLTTPELPEMRELPERLEFLQKTVTETLQALRIPPGPIKDVVIHNCTLIVSTPAIYALHQALRKQKLARYIENSHVVAALVQVACMHGESAIARQIRESLPSVLLGIYARYYGIPFMPSHELTSLRNFRRFEMDDERERKLRDAFIASLKITMEKVATVSAERFMQFVNPALKGTEANQAVAMEHVIRYSSRLIGRAAIDLKAAEEGNIHHVAAYVGVAYALASAYISTGKRFPVLFAESLTRGRHHRQRGGITTTSRHNLFALEDIMKATRCHEMPHFQGNDVLALYSVPDNIYVIPLDDVDGEPIWQCFWGPKRPVNPTGRGQSTRDAAKNIRLDPVGEELDPADNVLPAPDDESTRSSRSTRRLRTKQRT